MMSQAPTEAIEWLQRRREGVPPELHASMARALRGRAGRAADALLDAALDLLRDVLDGPEGRESAHPLLTADALLTYAFEAAAEDTSIDLAEFAARAAVVGRIGETLPPAGPGAEL